MKQFTLLHRFSLLSLVALLVFGAGLGWVVASSLEENYILRSKRLTARIIQEQVAKSFSGIDFSRPMDGPRYEEFAGKVPELRFAPEIKRVKVWNRDRMVVWSDVRELVGRRFPDNRSLGKALQGELSSEIKRITGSEHLYERQFSRLMELYVPIPSRPDGDIEFVFEIYQDLDPLYADIVHQRRAVYLYIFLGFTGVYLACFGIVWQASRRIEQQNREIRQSEERYQKLIQSAPDGIIGMDPGGHIVLFNKAAERLFVYPAEELLGKQMTVLIPDRHREGHQEGVRRFFESGPSAEMGRIREHEGLRKDGQIFPVEMSLSVSGDPGNLLVTGILRDISERKAMQEQLVAAEKQALVSVIAGSIGHEINNSIMGLEGYSELLREKPENVELARKSADVFGSQAQRLRLHAKNLLSLSKPRVPELRPLDVAGVLDRVTDVLTLSGPLKKFIVRREYAEILPPVLGDEMLLEQVFMNLEINAGHAMGDRGVLTLRVAPSADGSAVEISVSDTGHGFPESLRNQIFLPFFSTKEKGKGTGLGLHVVKQIVEQHAGTIDVRSVPAQGSTFTIRIPAEKTPVPS